jgi:signal transduction histidine kinase
VTSAIADSVAEALTNVARHADTGTVVVRAQHGSHGVRVEVSDRGRGFDPAEVAPHRRGCRESITGRMNAVGGTADIVSRRGTGTLVVLGWAHG